MASKVHVGNLAKISGEVNIAAGNIVKNIRTIYERSLTAAEEAAKARSLENKLLAEGVSSYLQRLQQQAKRRDENASPYKGLLEYRLEDAQAFFGRSTAIHDLLTVIDRGPLTILHAESGAGKTSLVQAGIVPRILAHGHLPIKLRPYNKLPSEVLKRTLLPDLSQSPLLAKAPLQDFLGRVGKILGPKTSLYVLIDQFEEFFNHIDPKEQKVFIDDLGECLDDASLNVHWLISLRTEYHGRLGNFQPRIRNIYENDYLLNRLARDEAREVITEPAKQHKIRFEKSLPDRIIDELCKDKQEVAPPQLQLVCSALFETLRPDERVINTELYEREGGATGILQGHLERVLKRLPPPHRSAALRVLEELITSVHQRAVCSREKLIVLLSSRGIDGNIADITINQLVENRLLRADEADEGTTYELAHDYLLDKITFDPEVKKRKQAEELLEQGVNIWKNQRLLFSVDALALIERQKDNLTLKDDELEFLIQCSVYYSKKPDKWLAQISNERKGKMARDWISSLNSKDEKTKKLASQVLWHLRGELPPSIKSRINFNKGITSTYSALWNGLKVIIILTSMFFVFAIVQYATPISTNGWVNVNSFEAQCIKGNIGAPPLIAINISDHSEIYAFDPVRKLICQSNDMAGTWKSISSGLPSDLNIIGITTNEDAYAITSTDFFRKKSTENAWTKIKLDNFQGYKITALGANNDQQSQVFLALEPTQVIKTEDGGSTWVSIDNGALTGKVTGIAANGQIIVAISSEGIWFQTKNGPTWKKFETGLNSDVMFTSILMLQPDDYIFFVSSTDGNVYMGSLDPKEKNGLIRSSVWPETGAISLAGYRTWEFVGNSQGIYCNATWEITQKEWWQSVLSHFNFAKRPCS